MAETIDAEVPKNPCKVSPGKRYKPRDVNAVAQRQRHIMPPLAELCDITTIPLDVKRVIARITP